MIDPAHYLAGLDIDTRDGLHIGAEATKLVVDTARGTQPQHVLDTTAAHIHDTHVRQIPDHHRFLAVAYAVSAVTAFRVSIGVSPLGCMCADPDCPARRIAIRFASADLTDGRDPENLTVDDFTTHEPEDVPEPVRTGGRLLGAVGNNDFAIAVALLRGVPDPELEALTAFLFRFAVQSHQELFGRGDR